MKYSAYKSAHREDIQGLRAIAVTAVVLFHAGLPFAGGFTGVDIFFVISGFVITAMLNREWQSTGKIDLKRFYFRRIKRLMPALAIVVSTTAILSVLFLSPLAYVSKVAMETGISAMLMIANIFIAKHTGGYFDAGADTNPFLHTWSLSVEEQFYIVFPAIWIAGLSISFRHGLKKAPEIIILSVGIISFAMAIYGYFHPGHFRFGFYSPLSRAWEFAAGAILACNGGRLIRETRFSANAAALFGLALIAIGFYLGTGGKPYPSFLTLLPVVGTVFLIASGTKDPENVFSKFLSTRPFVVVGDISYSWYLWHWPLIVLSAIFENKEITVLVAFLSIFLAAISYSYVETPIRNMHVSLSFRAVKIAALSIIPAIVLSMLLIQANDHGYWSKDIVLFKANIGSEHASKATGCGSGFVPTSPEDTHCLWNSDLQGTPIYLIGDSNADHLSEAIIAAGRANGSPVRIVSKGGCAFLGRSWSDRNDVEQQNCVTFVDSILKLIDQSKPGITVLGLSDSLWRIGESKVGPTRGTESADKTKGLEYLRHEMAEIVQNFQAKGNVVLFVKPVPKFVVDNRVIFDPQKCTPISILLSKCPEKVELSEAYEKSFQHDARSEIEIAAKSTNSEVVDLLAFFCPGGTCSNISEQGNLYHDAGHLSIEGSEILSGIFTDKIRSLVLGEFRRPEIF